ncbi:2'-5' RNA ligase family protein [Ruania halotolerans]|uniref:2'-5' RNA ligase family protein n=1 Tax=Ruania halotolerans TaxID=2897773 RepID=UPI001E44E3E2|nr:2'-5' RNA ligase family protein [Ruania halotolerans]UFU05617.1 2'-5' RNA ligase family protein [Ruania halotolerans]
MMRGAPSVPTSADSRVDAAVRSREGAASTVRIGVAIPIPEPYAASLVRARIDAQDPLAYAIPPHITLLPPTDISAEELADVHHHLSRIAAGQRPFVVELSGTDTFRPISPVVFVRVVAGIAECGRLQSAVNGGPVQQDLRFPYHPHVTLAHEVDEAALDAASRDMRTFDAVFPVAHFCLYEHGEDGVWRDVSTYVLTS